MNWSYALLRSIRVFAWAAFLVSAWRLSVKDWRVQKIKHRELAVGALFVAAVYGLLAFNTVLGLAGLTRSWYRGVFFRDLAVHLLLTAVAALGLWRARVWPAGDAKLFFLLGAVAPLLTREPSFQGGRFFFSALINIFLPACLFVFAQVAWYVWHTRLKHTLGYLREAGLKRAWDISMAAA
ncbi:MAG: hypothetical protein KGM24_11845, partial [Elusimicrobia bacterium]|nr:hypothetical protein [Elusimicrobiota bacterium]